MNKYPLIGGSICAVVVIVLASLTNVVGYQTVQISNRKITASEIDQKDLLFQTIVDMANKKDIQRVILGSQLTEKSLFDSSLRFSSFTSPIVTRRFLNFAYQMGLILSKTISKFKIHPMLEKYRMDYEDMRRKISSVIEKDARLKSEMSQLSSLSCDCNNENQFVWHFPVICTILLLFFYFIEFLMLLLTKIPNYPIGWAWILVFLVGVDTIFSDYFNCKWPL